VAADHDEHCKAQATGRPCETEAQRPRLRLLAFLFLSAGSALGPFSSHGCPLPGPRGSSGEEFLNTVAALSKVLRSRDERVDLVGAQNAFKGVGGHADFGQEGPSFQG
jgi:hypothetical protein